MSNSFKKYASEQYVDEQLSKIHLDWESIQNKPFEAEQVLYEWDDDLEYESIYSAEKDYYLEKISEDTLAKDSLINKCVHIEGISSGNAFNIKVLLNENMITGSEEAGGFATADYIIIALEDSMVLNDVTLSKGIWIINPNEEKDGVDLHKIQILNPSVPIDESVLPATVQSDWNENDSAKISYVQNKPFYTDSSSLIEIPVSLNEWKQMIDDYPLYMLTCRRSSVDTFKQVGDEISVIIDGEIHNGALIDQSGTLGFGDIDALQIQNITKIDFVLAYQYNENYSYEDYVILYKFPENITPTEVKIYSGTPVVKKIDEKYLPDSFKPTWDNIQDNPLMFPEVLYEWDEDVIYDERLLVQDATHAKISDEYVDAEDIIGKTIYLKQLVDGEVTEISTTIIEDYIIANDNGYVVADGLFIFIANDETDPDSGLAVTRGVWTLDGWDENGEEQSSRPLVAKILGDPVVQIDEKYIPSTIARVDDIPTLTATDDGAGNVTLSFN